MNSEIVRNTNREFYDKIAPVYDKIDKRRHDSRSHQWLDFVLEKISKNCNGTIFLDAGAGSGFLSLRAVNFFSKVIAADLSQPMLDTISHTRVEKIQCSCEELKIANESVDAVGAFATLHHLFNPNDFFKEAYRVLKSGGVLYTDHDIESQFIKNFSIPLKLYRYFFDFAPRYLSACKSLSLSDYKITEFHGESGIDGTEVLQQLQKIGFRHITIEYHWSGLLPFTPAWKIHGFSPLLRIMAKK